MTVNPSHCHEALLPRSASGEEHHKESEHGEGDLRTRHVAVLAFAMTCAGPFGIESCVRSFGALWACLGVLMATVIYVLPQICVTAELGSMLPLTNGGVVAWVDRAFGNSCAAVVALNMIIYQLVDLATYPTIVAGYTQQMDSLPSWAAASSQYVIVFLGLIMNLFNLKWATDFYTGLLLLVLLPFLIGFILSIPHWDVAWSIASGAVPATPDGDVTASAADWNLFLSTMLWLCTGWDSVGNLALEVETPRHLVDGLFLAAFAAPLVYLACTFGAMAAGPGSWDDGYLAQGYGRLWAPLKPWIVVMGGLSNFLLYTSELACLARMMESMVWGFLEYLPCRLGDHWERGAHVLAVLSITAIQCLLVAGLSFEYLVELSSFLHVIALEVCTAAFLQLRFASPRPRRVWTVPGGDFGSVIMALLLFFVLTVLVVSAFGTPSVVYGALIGNIFFAAVSVVLLPKGCHQAWFDTDTA